MQIWFKRKCREQRWLCWYCERPMNHKAKGVEMGSDPRCVTRDHLVPPGRAPQGYNAFHPDNIRPACYACNTAKGNLTEQEFRWLFPTVEQIHWLDSAEGRNARYAELAKYRAAKAERRAMAKQAALHDLSQQF